MSNSDVPEPEEQHRFAGSDTDPDSDPWVARIKAG
jgi:hypothetical protein